MSLAINNITVIYGQHRVLDNFTLPNICCGEVVTLIGKNGAGKSTLLKHLTHPKNLLTSKISWQNQPLDTKQIGYLPQDHRIHAAITVIELLITALNVHSNSLFVQSNSAERALQLLDEMDILHLANKTCTELSGGESQMVGLAQAVINQPKVLILDEPTSALDMKNQLKLLSYVRKYAKHHQACVLMVVHDLNLAIQYSDKVAALNQGQLAQFGAPKEIITTQLIQDIFEVESEIIPMNDYPIVIVKAA